MYYNNLLPMSKAVYNQIYFGIKKHLSSFTIFCTKPSMVAELFRIVKLDNPDLFYVREVRIQNNAFKCIVYPEYLFSVKTTHDILSAIRKKTSSVISLFSKCSDEVQIVKGLHDYLCATVTYSNVQSIEAHSIIGPFLNSEGVCEGIACAFLYLAKQLNIDALLLFGQARQMNDNAFQDHAWNIVRLSGMFYHIDVTFDLTQVHEKTSTPRYDYFLVSDSQISFDHRYFSSPYIMIPSCSDGYNYYMKCGTFAESLQSLHLIISTEIMKKDEITFQLPIFRGKTEDVPRRIQNEIDKILYASNVSTAYEMSYNLNRMVFRLKLFR